MNWQTQASEEIWPAIDGYLKLAYGDKSLPAAVKTRLETLRGTEKTALFASPVFERDAADPPRQFSLRLGNRIYPHMKLVTEVAPDGSGHLFRADTHDGHIRPSPDSKEYAMFCKLIEDNQRLAESIENAWEQAGLPTFKQYLRADLARRAAQAA